MMKNRNFKIHIEEPCKVSKENFTPTTNGFFCSSCQKCVVDYTQYSDQELARSMSRPQASSCGIFTKEQLDKVYQEKPEPQAKSRSLPALLLSGLFLTGHSLKAQEEPLVDSISVVKATEDTLSHEVLEATIDTLVVDELEDTNSAKTIKIEVDSFNLVIGNITLDEFTHISGTFAHYYPETELSLVLRRMNEIARNPVDTAKRVINAIRDKPKPASDESKDTVPKEKPLAWLSNLISKRFRKEEEEEGSAV